MQTKNRYPCRNCAYLLVCGNTNRTQPCVGRQTKSEKKKEFALMVNELYEECLDMDFRDYGEFEKDDKNYIADLILKHGYNRAREILMEAEYINK